jgi:hypothetical protein
MPISGTAEAEHQPNDGRCFEVSDEGSQDSGTPPRAIAVTTC